MIIVEDMPTAFKIDFNAAVVELGRLSAKILQDSCKILV